MERGVIHLTLLIVLFPLLFMALAGTMSISGKGQRLQNAIWEERAFLACEAGVDEAISRASRGLLAANATTEFTGTLDPNGTITYQVSAKHLFPSTGDDVFQVDSVGTSGRARRHVVAYLGRVPGPPLLDAAVSLYHHEPQVQLDYKGVGYITGFDTNMDGSPGPNDPVTGLAIKEPGTVADLLANFQVDNPERTTGKGGTPSYGTSTGLDLDELVNKVKNSAPTVLNDSYNGASFGDGPGGNFRVLYREGDLQLYNFTGAGIIVVTGKLQVADSFRFDGLVIVLGDIQMDGSSGGNLITGALIQGPTGKQLQIADAVRIRYSTEALSKISLLGSEEGKYVSFNGWQEVAR